MVRGFVAVGILSDESADIGGSLFAHVALGGEQAVELREEGIVASEEVDESVDVVRYEPGVLPCVALGVVVGAMDDADGVEGLAELSFAVYGAHESRCGIEILAVGAAALVEEAVVVVGSELLGHACCTVFSQAVFQCFGNGLVGGLEVVGYVAVLLEQSE